MTAFDTAIDAIASGPSSHWKLNEASGTACADRKAARAMTYEGTYSLGQANLTPQNDGAQTSFTPQTAGDAVRASTLFATGNPAFSFACRCQAASSAVQFAFGQNDFTHDNISLGFTTGGSVLARLFGGGTTTAATSAGSLWTTGTAYTLGMSYDGSSMYVFLDGVQVATAAKAAITMGGNFYLGRGFGGRWTGTIQNVAYWTSALSEAQHAAFHSAATVLIGGGGGTASSVLRLGRRRGIGLAGALRVGR